MDLCGSEIWTLLGGLISGLLGGSLLTLKLTKSQRVNGSGISVDQSKAKAGGDIVGRDKKSN